ncbi:hypothetical protein [Fusibacter sp. 3D3]|uniref:hypothetical protein n=1 Tax=Fusibacter sp. 3D3 TaxID=1048380 RepID=UPI000852D03B|nr:hypothetical protein [Fusibacter sp. 3D3]GAU75739.1 hypothetical protein F3D3_0330 [Fusibacter sp. 3D3]
MSQKNRALLFDLIFFMIIVVLGEFINSRALSDFYSGYYFSVTLIVSFIMIFRWGAYGIPFAMLSGLVTYLFMGETHLETALIYIFGNMGIVSSYLFLKWQTTDEVKQQTGLCLPFVLSGYMTIVVLRGVIMALLGEDLLSACFLVLSNEMLNIIAVTLFVTLLMKQKSIMIHLKALYEQEEVKDEH